MKKLEAFANWRISAKRKLENICYSVNFFDSPKSDNNSMRIDFKNNKIEATVAAWENGNFVSEAFIFESQEFQNFSFDCNSDNQMWKLLDENLDKLIKISNN